MAISSKVIILAIVLKISLQREDAKSPIFSHQCYRDKCEQWLLDQINTGNDSGGWRVFLCSLQSLTNEEHDKLIAELREALSTQEKFTIILS